METVDTAAPASTDELLWAGTITTRCELVTGLDVDDLADEIQLLVRRYLRHRGEDTAEFGIYVGVRSVDAGTDRGSN